MDRSAIVLSDVFSSRLRSDVDFLDFKGKPLVKHIVEVVSDFVDEVVLVVDSQDSVVKYAKVLGSDVKFAVCNGAVGGSLVGVLAGFEVAGGRFCLVLPSNAPFVFGDIVDLFFDLCLSKSAVVPRWPNQQVEALFAVYNTQFVLEAAKEAVAAGKVDVDELVEGLRGVRYVSTLVVQELDPELKLFFRVNGLVDLKKAAVLTKPRKTKKK